MNEKPIPQVKEYFPQVGEYWECQPATHDYPFTVEIIEILDEDEFRVEDNDAEAFIASKNELFKYCYEPKPNKFTIDENDEDIPF